ncbi:hypothetical protein GOV08_02965 [Candidatus Woesearchaeota archaeon]|nr:hypothetical protein [Candidatus Woesearchaeota archaeon]
MKLGKPIKYIAVPPKEVVERVKKRIKEDAITKQDHLEEIKTSTVLDELSTLYEQGVELVEPSDLSGSLRGRDNLYNHLELMINSAAKSVIMMTTEQGFLRKITSLKKALSKAKQRGVDIKIAAPITEKTKKDAKELFDVAQVRDMKDVKARFVIVDDKELTFMILDDEEVHPAYDVGIWVNTPFFSNALVGLFDLAWDSIEAKQKV